MSNKVKIDRAIIRGTEDAGLKKAKLHSDGGYRKITGVLDGREITVNGVPSTPGHGGDEKLSWKKARDTIRFLRQSGKSLTYYNS
jgi:hypothetical protein